MRFWFLSMVFVLSLSAMAKVQYTHFQVGCLSPVSELAKLNCTEENLSYEIIKTHYESRLPSAKKDMENAIFNRARFFLDKKEFDYFSVLMIMAFPVPEKEKWLGEFKKLPGKRAPFSIIALDRIQGKESSYCEDKKQPIFLKEICAFKILK